MLPQLLVFIGSSWVEMYQTCMMLLIQTKMLEVLRASLFQKNIQVPMQTLPMA
jgi:hypothetical protein